ncbi:MAG TPA: sigma-70 family RNA polymerase sigma factor [Pyrinomonadaceae bacterium]|nr:sigma-70 family RNA polymerase sigma factor [Pyrinomonadaceae bacterium]
MRSSEVDELASGAAPEGITQLLLKWSGGDSSAREELMPLVYVELRRLAAKYLRRERINHTLQPTALVNEAYLRLIDQRKVEWQSRAQFFGLAARLMRNILVDHARSHQAAKRGGQQLSVSLSRADRVSKEPAIDLVALHETLERLAAHDEQKGRIVELRFFGGLTIEETAEVLEISHATVERDWKLARAWLRCELG